MPEQTSHGRPHDPTLRSGTLDRLALFQRSFPRSSIKTAGAGWTFRRTLGQRPQATTILMLPGIQGGAMFSLIRRSD